jgi:hypothetical protein
MHNSFSRMCSIPMLLFNANTFHSGKNVSLTFEAAGENFRSINDGSLVFSVRQQSEWRNTSKKIPPLCILEWKRASMMALSTKKMKAFQSQVSGEMLAVVLRRVEVFGKGQVDALTDEQRTARLYRPHTNCFG